MSFYAGSLLLTSLASLLLGVFVYSRGKDKLANRTLGLFAGTLALWCFGQFMGEMAGLKAAVLFWTRLGVAGAVMIPVFFVHFILSLVERSDQEMNLIRAVYGIGAVFLLLVLTPFFVRDVRPMLDFRFYPEAGIAYPFFALFILASFAYAFFRLFSSYRRAADARRNQLLYVTLAALIGFAGGITAFFPIWGIRFPVLSHLTLPFYVLITVYAIVKHKLLDISVIVRKGLVYSALTVFFAGFYALAVLVASFFFSSFHLAPALTVLLVVFASVLVFQPVRDRVQKGVDRLFYMGEFRYRKTIDDLSAENLRLYRSLLQADKLAALGTISAGMAHEIKNPLASIKGMTQVLEENLDDPDFINKYQGVVGRQVDRINHLVEKLLKFGQPRGLTLSRFDLGKAIEDVHALLESQFRKGGVRVHKELKKLPQVSGDAEELSQVFMNLFLNALQAMPQGGKLSIRADVQGPKAVIVVSDSGIGIPADQLDRIFDPFFSTKEDGSGMGLAVAYRVVKEHGGDIMVESETGKGTKFTLWLPIRRERSA